MRFSSGKELYDYISAGNELYCEENGIYVFSYNESGSICVYYNIDTDKAAELVELSREYDEYWESFLGASANQIFDSAEHMKETTQLSEYEDEALSWCNEQYKHDWIGAKEYGKELGAGKLSQCLIIRWKEDLKNAYILLNCFRRHVKENASNSKARYVLFQIKRAIRSFHKKEKAEREMRLVKSYGIDGFIMLTELPDFLQSVEEAREYFEKEKMLVCKPSAHDCTGQSFTVGYKIVERQGKFWAFHHVGHDV